MKYLFKAEVASSSLRDALDQAEYFSLFGPDIMMRMASYNRDLKGYRGEPTNTVNRSWRTKVKKRPSILDALGLFLEVLETGTHKFSGVPSPGSTWNSRDRHGLSGVLMPGWTLSHSTLGDWYPIQDAGDLAFVGVDFLSKDGVIYMPADYIFRFAQNFFAEMSPDREIYWYSPIQNNAGEPPGGIYPGGLSHWTLQYLGHTVTDDVIRYTVRIHGYTQLLGGPFTWQYAETRYDVEIKRQTETPWAVDFRCSEGRGISSFAPVFHDHATHPLDFDWGVWQPALDVKVKTSSTDRAFETLSFGVQFPLSVMRCTPALYHTQSRAFYSLMGKVSEGFESLIESPDFLPVCYNFLRETSSIPFSAAHLPFIQRLRTIVKLICGSYLAYIFAIAPALKSAREVWDRFKRGVRSSPGEGELKFKGYAADLDSVPTGLRDWIGKIRSAEIFDFKVSFRTSLTPFLDDSHAPSVLEALLADAAHLGVEPDPTYLYQALPFTFVFDEFVPMASLMRDAYQRFKLIRTRGLTVGHSISLTVTYVDGLTVSQYIRSDDTGIYLDPAEDSWLTAPGASAPVLIPLALGILL